MKAPDDELVAGYRALRERWGAHPVARDVLTVSGPDAVEYLQGQCSQDLAALAVGEQADTLLLSPGGKLVTLMRAVRRSTTGFLLDVTGGFGEDAAARLAHFVLRAKVDISRVPWTCVALRGPEAAAMLGTAAGVDVDPVGAPHRAAENAGTWFLPVAWNGTLGVDILGPDPGSCVPGGAHWCGAGAWEALRVEAGIPEMGKELDERTIAVEAGLVSRSVSFTKGCYTGQELMARLEARGNRVTRHLRGVIVAGPDRVRCDAASLAGATVSQPGSGKAVGTCTSSAWCPGLDGPAALAYVHRSVTVPGPVTVDVTHLGSPEVWSAEATELPIL